MHCQDQDHPSRQAHMATGVISFQNKGQACRLFPWAHGHDRFPVLIGPLNVVVPVLTGELNLKEKADVFKVARGSQSHHVFSS
jgi:hypothetical protein